MAGGVGSAGGFLPAETLVLGRSGLSSDGAGEPDSFLIVASLVLTWA